MEARRAAMCRHTADLGSQDEAAQDAQNKDDKDKKEREDGDEAAEDNNDGGDDQEGEEEDDDEELPSLEEMFPPLRALGLFLVESAANHSCNPSAHVSPISGAGGSGIEMVAARPIAAGEEVTISYLGELPVPPGNAANAETEEAEAARRRRALLREQYLFECGCERCAGALG